MPGTLPPRRHRDPGARLRGGRRALSALCLALALAAGAARAAGTYTVAPGDTLYALARRFHTTVAALREVNDLGGNLLTPGQVLRLPGGDDAGYHITFVRPGERLADVAARVGRKVATLASANPGLAGSVLPVGAAVSVPPADGVTAVAAAGDTLASLAARAGVPVARLAALNGLDPGAPLQVGRPVLLPVSAGGSGGGVPAAASAAGTRAEAPAGSRAPAAPALPAGAAVAATAAGAQPAAASPRARLTALQNAALFAAVTRLPDVRLSEDSFIAPVHGRLSSRFGWRALSVDGNHFHAGIDLAVPTGTPVHAARDGVVVEARWDGTYGNVVFLDHGDGSQTRYAHMSRIAVHVGDRVRQGDVLGYAGSTGWSTGPHVHFELRFDGRAVDPLDYLRGTATP